MVFIINFIIKILLFNYKINYIVVFKLIVLINYIYEI